MHPSYLHQCTYSPLPQNHSWLLGKTPPFSVTIPTAGGHGVVVEVKEGVVVSVSSSEWAGHVGQELSQIFY